MTYEQAIAYLYGLAAVGIKLGLRRTRVLLRALGSPERSFPCVLVAGTNGKGSVAAMIHRALRAAGLRAALYTSPHLVRFEERIVVGDEPMPREEVAASAERLQGLIRGLLAGGGLDSHPTYFEVVTAMALAHFAGQGAEAAVLEVGLGGRFDATNAVEPAVSVITRVALDHTEYLGSALRQVAFEKAGILRPLGQAVTSCPPGEALEVIREVAERGATRLQVVAEACRFSGAEETEEGMRFDLRTPAGEYPGLRLALRGEHQLENAGAAVLALEALAAQGLPLAGGSIDEGLSRVRWPGRLERVAGSPPLLLDCAHNPDGAAALARYLARSGGRPVTLLFGVMGDKDLRGMAVQLFPLARRVVLTRPSYHRALDPAEAARLTSGLAGELHVEPDPELALRAARKLAGPEGLLVVAGSLFLVADVKRILAGELPEGQG